MTLTATGLDAITNPNIIGEGKLADNIFKKTPEWDRLWSKKRRFEGGTNIRCPLEYAMNTTGGAFTGTATRALDNPVFITDARVELKEYYMGVTVSDRQRCQNCGAEAIVSLVDTSLENASKSLRHYLCTDFHDTSATEPNTQTFEGMKDILSSTSTYAGIAVADFAGWAAQIDASTTALSIAAMLTQYEDQAQEGDVPTVIYTTHALFAKYGSVLQAQQRFMTAEKASAGFPALEFLGIPVFRSTYVPGSGSGTSDNYMEMLNENYIYLYIAPEFNGDMGKWKDAKPESAGWVNSIELKGGLIVSNRRMQGAFTTLDPAK